MFLYFKKRGSKKPMKELIIVLTLLPSLGITACKFDRTNDISST